MKPGTSEAARNRCYNSTVKKLQARAEHQVLLLQQAKEGIDHEHELQLILADGICQQKVMYEQLKPLHDAWLQGEHLESRWEPSGSADCATLVKLVDNCNPMLSALLSANPQQVREAVCFTRDQLMQTHTKVFMELLVLLELNSPDRYHGEEAITLADGSTAAALGQMPGGLDRQLVGDLPGSCSSNPAAVEAEARAVASAAAAAEEQLNEVVRQSLRLGGLLLLHQPGLMMDMCSINFSNKQRCVAPLGQFAKAASRLGLSEGQLTHMRLMLQQYNRSMRMQMQEGLALLEVSERSSASLKLVATTESSLSGSTKSAQDATDTLPGSSSGSGDQEQGDAVVGLGADVNSQLAVSMQKHVEERMQVMLLMGFWIANTLSPRQMAKFIVYSWPYYPLCSALAEASTLLRPTAHDDSNMDAQDSKTFMAWRRDGMHKELEWLMQYAAEMADSCLHPLLD